MEKAWKISDSEWLVLRCLWKKSPLRLKEITEMLREETGWSSNMVRAMIVRLQEKEAIGVERTGHSYGYYPIADEAACVKQETESFLDRVFERSVSRLFLTLADTRGISDQELDELERLIQKLKAEE